MPGQSTKQGLQVRAQLFQVAEMLDLLPLLEVQIFIRAHSSTISTSYKNKATSNIGEYEHKKKGQIYIFLPAILNKFIPR